MYFQLAFWGFLFLKIIIILTNPGDHKSYTIRTVRVPVNADAAIESVASVDALTPSTVQAVVYLGQRL